MLKKQIKCMYEVQSIKEGGCVWMPASLCLCGVSVEWGRWWAGEAGSESKSEERENELKKKQEKGNFKCRAEAAKGKGFILF